MFAAIVATINLEDTRWLISTLLYNLELVLTVQYPTDSSYTRSNLITRVDSSKM